MKCKVCGAECGSGFKFCPMCASPMENDPKAGNRTVKKEETITPPQFVIRPREESNSGASSDSFIKTSTVESFVSPEPQDDEDSTPTRFDKENVYDEKKPSLMSRLFSTDDELDEMFDEAAQQEEREYAAQHDTPPDQRSIIDNAAANSKRFSLFDDSDDDVGDFGDEDFDEEAFDDIDLDEEISKKKRNAAFFATVGGLLVTIVLTLFIIVNVNFGGSLKLFLSTIFEANPITESVKIEKGYMDDGSNALIITVYAKEGSTVRFSCGDIVQDAVVTDEYVTFRVSESLYVPMTPVDGEAYVIKPDIKVISENGDIFVPEIPDVNIPVPKLTLVLSEPQNLDILTYTGSVEVAGTVDDPKALLYAGDTPIQVDSSGAFRTVVSVAEPGKHTVNIEARRIGYSIARITLNIEYQDEGSSITILNETLRTTEESINIRGTMDRGATVSVSGVELIGEVVSDSDAGTFNFTVSLPTEKLYLPTVTVASDQRTSNVKLYVERAPILDDYRQSAHALDYDRITRSPTHNAHYMIRGTVDMVITTKPYCIARIQTEDGPLYFEYYYTTPVEVGDNKRYTLFGFPNGRYTHDGEELPIIYVWFVLKNDIQ